MSEITKCPKCGGEYVYFDGALYVCPDCAYEFDGGKAEGFAIKGLSAPLFGTTSATITNVDLVDVNITESERIISGSLVCELAEGGSVSNCSVSGSYTYNKNNYCSF